MLPPGAVGQQSEVEDELTDFAIASELNVATATPEQRIADRRPFSLDGRPELWYNRVEGLHAGVELDAWLYERLQLRVGGGFSERLQGTDRWTYQTRARLLLGAQNDWEVTAGYRVGVQDHYDSRLYGPFLNSLTYVFGGDDYFDYYRKEAWRVELAYAGLPWDSRVAVDVTGEEARSLEAATSYDVFGSRSALRPNPAVVEDRLLAVGATAVIGERDFRPRGLFGQRQARLRAEVGSFDNGGDDADYLQLSADLHGRIATFNRDDPRPMALDVRLKGGTYTGTLPAQRAQAVDGSLGIYTPFGALRTKRGLPYVGGQHVGLFYEHNFRSTPFAALGVDWAADRDWHLLLWGAHGRAWAADGATQLRAAQASDGFHHEVGVSLNRLLSVVRLDVGVRLDEPGVFAGVAVARIF